jgi:hypothetical protein
VKRFPWRVRARRTTVTWLATALLLTGCATTPRESPPEVAPQPPDITTQQAVREGEASATQTEAAVARAEATERAQRARPTALSTREIRERNAAAGNPLDFRQRLDYVHDRAYTKMQSAVEATDRHFASDDEALKPVPAAPFRIGTSLLVLDHADGAAFSSKLNVDIALQLPNIQKRLRIFVTSDELDAGPRDSSGRTPFRAGLRYALVRDLDFDLGLRIDIPPVAFAAVRWSREIALGSWDFYPLAKLFAETKESVGYATGATFDQWTGRRLLRSSTFAKWRHDRDRTEWSQTFIFARAKELLVPDRYGSYPAADDIGRGWGVRLQASGPDGRHVSRYESGLLLRGRAPNRWLFWFVEPLVRWDREWNWSADPGVRVGIDMLFWDLARPARRNR